MLIDVGSKMYMSGTYEVLIIQDFLEHYVWIDVGSMMYMSGKFSFIV